MWNAITHSRIGLVIGITTIMGITTPSWAIPLTFSYEGNVTSITGKAKHRDTFNAVTGERFLLTYHFESTTPDILPASPTAGLFTGAITDYSVTLGLTTYSGSTGTIVVDNQGFAFGTYTIFDTFSISGPQLHGFEPTSVLALFDDFSHTVFSDDSLPLTQPDPQDFDQSFLQLELRQPISQDLVTITASNNLQINAAGNGGPVVPEPSTLLLFGSGIVALSLWRYGLRVR